MPVFSYLAIMGYAVVISAVAQAPNNDVDLVKAKVCFELISLPLCPAPIPPESTATLPTLVPPFVLPLLG